MTPLLAGLARLGKKRHDTPKRRSSSPACTAIVSARARRSSPGARPRPCPENKAAPAGTKKTPLATAYQLHHLLIALLLWTIHAKGSQAEWSGESGGGDQNGTDSFRRAETLGQTPLCSILPTVPFTYLWKARILEGGSEKKIMSTASSSIDGWIYSTLSLPQAYVSHWFCCGSSRYTSPCWGTTIVGPRGQPAQLAGREDDERFRGQGQRVGHARNANPWNLRSSSTFT